MKTLIINTSPRKNWNTAQLLQEVFRGAENAGVETEYIDLFDFLFTGDISSRIEEKIVKDNPYLNVDVLKVAHHGSNTSTCEEFISVIKPEYSIISVGKNNRYGHPNDDVLENLDDSKIYRTDQDGSIMFKISKNKFYIATCIP